MFQFPVSAVVPYKYIEALLRVPIALKLYRFVAFESVHKILVLLFTLFSTSVIPALFASGAQVSVEHVNVPKSVSGCLLPPPPRFDTGVVRFAIVTHGINDILLGF
jgi:hypothetical protein